MLNAIGQCLSVLAAFLFPTPEGPRFVKGCATNLAFAVLGFIISVGMTVYYRVENKRRDEREGGKPPRDMPINVLEEYDLAKGEWVWVYFISVSFLLRAFPSTPHPKFVLVLTTLFHRIPVHALITGFRAAFYVRRLAFCPASCVLHSHFMWVNVTFCTKN
jgi:hypothetical protein